MLGEIESAPQDDPAQKQRWFQDDFFDLFVRTTSAGSIVAFQLCYERLHNERMVGWSSEDRLVHKGIDDGQATPVKNMKPIFVVDGSLDATQAEIEFSRRCACTDADIATFVQAKTVGAKSLLASDDAARQN